MSFSAYSNTSRPRLSPTYTLHLILLFLSCFSLQVSAWFIVTEPNKSTVWANGRTNVLRWNKGLLDGVHGFDVELSRMSRDGLTLVARNVPTHKTFALNIHLTDVPPGDDYVVLLINATHGHMHAVSQRFSILDAPPSPSTDSTSILGDGKEMGEEAVEGSKTVSVSGAPDPTRDRKSVV